MTRGDAEKAVRERWERMGLDPEAAPITFSEDVNNALRLEEEKIVQAAYRKQTGETGRSVVQYSDPAS